MSQLSPIVLFVYNRPEHTRQTVEALAANELASESELFIYSDAPKNDAAAESVRAVRSYIRNIQGFKSVSIIEREKNWGLAANIINGVTEIVNRYGKIIVLEDDIVTSPYFLRYMNDALEYYKNENRVWNISAYIYPIENAGLSGAFFSRSNGCWGWGTWGDRWQYYEKDADKLVAQFSKEDIKKFDVNGTANFWQQILDNQSGKINTWAVFWDAIIFKNGGLVLVPSVSFIQNIGMDASGVHCSLTDIYYNNKLCKEKIDFSGIPIEENKMATDYLMKYFRKINRSNNFLLKILKNMILQRRLTPTKNEEMGND